jgi:prevent-host-death family protein
MTRTVTATEAKNRLGALLRVVSEEGDTVVIENRRERAAILVPVADYEELQALRKNRQRREAIEEIWQIAARQAALNSDLSEAEADELVQRAINDIREMRKENAIRALEQAN